MKYRVIGERINRAETFTSRDDAEKERQRYLDLSDAMGKAYPWFSNWYSDAHVVEVPDDEARP